MPLLVPNVRRSIHTALLAVSTLLIVAPLVASAQTSPPRDTPAANSEFFLRRPKGALAVKGGWLFANTGSDLYDFVTEQLTLERKAFNAPAITAELSVAIGPRFEVVAGYERAKSSTASEYRKFVDNRNQPIAQDTVRKEDGVAGTVRMSLWPRGQRISRFAWIPRTVTPYVGVGAGAIRYEFEQFGSFVDADTLRVFDDTFRSSGWAPSVHALVGADVRVFRLLYLTVEGRYTRASAPLTSDFVGFAPVSLGGFRVNSGLQLVF